MHVQISSDRWAVGVQELDLRPVGELLAASDIDGAEAEAVHLTVCDPGREMVAALRRGERVSAYIIVLAQSDGYLATNEGWPTAVVLHDQGYTGIEWGADADWLPTADIREAIELWARGEY